MTVFFLVYLLGMIGYAVWLHFDSTTERQFEKTQIEDCESKSDKALEIVFWPLGMLILLLCIYQERIEKREQERRMEQWRESEGGR